jgi:X-X-X-Leu-X-X-Gly heptad repeat protein
MSGEAKQKLGATKLDEGATKLDEGATKLHEGAAVLHEIAATMSDADGHGGGTTSASEGRTRIMQLRTAVVRSGARAVELVQRHPVGTLAAVGIAAAFIEVELAAGLLVGGAVAALLVEQAGPEVRQRILTAGRQAVERARSKWASRTGEPARESVAAATAS